VKKLGIVFALAILIVIGVAVGTAGKMGETSHAYARGRVVLDDKLKDKAQSIETLFLIVGYPDRPMPYGAQRKKMSPPLEGELYEFVLTTDSLQRMMEAAPWPDHFKIKARLDRDGSAGPDQPGDLTGEVTGLSPGVEGVEIKIDHEVQ
jgi:hypothetical protein